MVLTGLIPCWPLAGGASTRPSSPSRRRRLHAPNEALLLPPAPVLVWRRPTCQFLRRNLQQGHRFAVGVHPEPPPMLVLVRRRHLVRKETPIYEGPLVTGLRIHLFFRDGRKVEGYMASTS